jgi:crotonobetainyl-CoA:carnitine CoA-transferase CaiB-like acyl-CoA transferase
MWGAALQLMYPFAVEAMASGESPQRVGNKGYSGSPASEYFPTQDGFIGVGANTAQQIAKVYAVLGWSAADAQADLLTGPGFARAKDPQAFRDKLARALLAKPAAEWEILFNAAGIPAARVRHLAEFTTEVQALGALQPTVLTMGADTIATPGFGWVTT